MGWFSKTPEQKIEKLIKAIDSADKAFSNMKTLPQKRGKEMKEKIQESIKGLREILTLLNKKQLIESYRLDVLKNMIHEDEIDLKQSELDMLSDKEQAILIALANDLKKQAQNILIDLEKNNLIKK